MTDIAERLRTFDAWEKVIARFRLTKQAADEIERLRAALRAIETKSRGWERGTSAEINKIAKEALDE